MAALLSVRPSTAVSAPEGGLSTEIRRFSAGIRAVTALLLSAIIVSDQHPLSGWAVTTLLAYSVWACWLLWAEAGGGAWRTGLWCYWVDVAWATLTMALLSADATMLILMLVYPVVLTSIGYGVRQGVLLALVAALGLIVNGSSAKMLGLGQGLGQGWRHSAPAMLVLFLVPAVALLALPMNVLRRRLALVGELEAELDPRRGLEQTCIELAERLRSAVQADAVVLMLPSNQGAAVLASREEGSFRLKPEIHARLEELLSTAPDCPLTYVRRAWWDLRPGVRLHASVALPPGLSTALAALAQTLGVRSLHGVPLTRYARGHGHFLVGFADLRGASSEVRSLAAVVPELLHIVEQAALVDQLQEEIAGHERARIGRDLHDSAIQPYLGLKYAVECVALRIPRDNPARAEVDSLAELVNGEVAALRELISGLRTGSDRGDNALVPAVRRQVRRFALLFGIEVFIDCPGTLPTTRALAGALFHLVNEALNNVRKHTIARHVWLKLSVEGATIQLMIRDDGASMRGQRGADFCPTSLSERTAELGGTLQVTYPDGLNTELVIQIPCGPIQKRESP